MESNPHECGTVADTSRTPTDLNNQEPGRKAERRRPGQRQAIKWPRANEVTVGQHLDKDFSFILEHSLRVWVEAKLNRTGDFLYKECRGRFGKIIER